jgi:hypothetical protein
MTNINCCTRQAVERFLCGPKLANCKSGGQKGCRDWSYRSIITPLLGVIELTFLCAFICKMGYFDAQIRETILYKEGFDLLTSFEKCNWLFTRNKITKQHASLIISSIPSLKNIAQIPSHSSSQINLFSSFYLFLP